MSLLEEGRAAALRGLERAGHLLEVGARGGLLGARLAPDMMPLADQIGCAASCARRATLALVDDGFDAAIDWTGEEARLRALLADVRAQVEGASGAVLPRIETVAGEARLSLTPEDHLRHFAVPNLWFHVSMAYAILRAHGAPVGKADYDALHLYT
ncbi:MAG: DUF1993 family protein [Hasllibacter sp.]